MDRQTTTPPGAYSLAQLLEWRRQLDEATEKVEHSIRELEARAGTPGRLERVLDRWRVWGIPQ